ncbi:MAG: hypothetical protein U5Q44_02995 [Dehalococcoidia bacterium]|nr:hypothetical protein [Dehalococcoidia bacterium]
MTRVVLSLSGEPKVSASVQFDAFKRGPGRADLEVVVGEGAEKELLAVLEVARAGDGREP